MARLASELLVLELESTFGDGYSLRTLYHWKLYKVQETWQVSKFETTNPLKLVPAKSIDCKIR